MEARAFIGPFLAERCHGVLIDSFNGSIDVLNGRGAMSMNIHHLELFYHVAQAGGVSAAARRMPYGIQQPAISAQIRQLEDSLGKPLFQRRPFELTAEGETLLAFIEPFFSRLPGVAEKLRGGADHGLRIACPEIVQRDYLPALLSAVRAETPDFHFSLHSGRVDEIKAGLRAGEIDLGLATCVSPEGEGVEFRELLRIPPVLLVAEDSPVRSAEEIFGMDRIDLPLITLPRGEPTVALFLGELEKRRIEWFPMLELAGLDLVARFVTGGHGVGLALEIPGAPKPEGVRVLELPDFPDIGFYALTAGAAPPMAEGVVREAERMISRMRAGR